MKLQRILIFLLFTYATSLYAQVVTYVSDMNISDNSCVVDTIQRDSSSITVPITSIQDTLAKNQLMYLWDMREQRDAMQKEMRLVRDSMRTEIRMIRDSARNDARELAQRRPHAIRIGWGDQLFETLVWYHQPHSTIYPESYIGQYEEDFRYVQHWFAEYQYRVKYWFNVGAMVDYSSVLWDKVRRNGKGEELDREEDCSFHNIAVMLTMRFTYFHSKYVSFYSGLGVGLNINTGSELDYLDRHTAFAPALNITALGMNVGNNRWFGAVEFGGLYSLANINEVYMAGSRMFTVSVGFRFR